MIKSCKDNKTELTPNTAAPKIHNFCINKWWTNLTQNDNLSMNINTKIYSLNNNAQLNDVQWTNYSLIQYPCGNSKWMNKPTFN